MNVLHFCFARIWLWSSLLFILGHCKKVGIAKRVLGQSCVKHWQMLIDRRAESVSIF